MMTRSLAHVRPGFLMPIEDLACAALLVFYSVQGAIPFIAPPQAFETTAGASTALSTTGGLCSQMLVNLIIVLLVLRRPRLVLQQVMAVPWLVLFALLAIASTAWSLDPVLTLRRSILFTLAGLFGLYFAARFSPVRQFAILRLAIVAAALATIAVVFLVPSLGFDHSAGHSTDWQGIFTQKNACGRAMVLGATVVLFGERLMPVRLACLALFLFVLVRSGSRGAWIVGATVLLLWLFVFLGRRAGAGLRLVLGLGAPPLALALFVAGILFYPRLAPLLGRDATLTGRTAIWREVLHFVALRPWLGYGYDAFWRGMQGPSLQVSASVHFVVVHAHNGFLEIVLELGAIGLLLFLAGWARAASNLWPAWRRGEIGRLAWPLAVLVLILIYDLDENTLLIYNGLFWVLYVSAAATAEQIARDCRHTAPQPAHAILSEHPGMLVMRPRGIPQETS